MIISIIFLPLITSILIYADSYLKLIKNNKIIFILSVLQNITSLIFSFWLLNRTKEEIITEKSSAWLNNFNFGISTDNISLTFLSVILLISLIIQIYTYGNIKNFNNFNKYFISFNVLNFAISGMILSANYIQFFIFQLTCWICLYLAITYLNDNKLKINKCLYFNLIIDILFILGVLIYFNYLNFLLILFIIFSLTKTILLPNIWVSNNFSKSSSVFYIYLNSIYTITTGTFFLLKIYPLFTDEILKFTLIAALIATITNSVVSTVQINLNKLFSYIITSSIGFIYILISLQSVSASIIYAVVLTFNITLIMLCADIIPKYFNTYDIREIKGLRKLDYSLNIYFLIGILSLSGIFFGGFTIKEILINIVKSTNNNYILFIVLLGCYILSYSIFKTYFKIFSGETTTDKVRNQDKTNTIVLRTLCLFVILPGLMLNKTYINIISLVALLIFISGAVSAYFEYKSDK